MPKISKKESKTDTKTKAPKKPKAVMGRPTIYTEELAARICHLIATQSFGLKKLCRTFPELPDADTIRRWYRENTDFYGRYIQAKRDQADLIVEEILEISDDAQNDWMETTDEDGGVAWKLNGEHVQRSRLRIDSRKWLAAKLSPKIYGQNNNEDKKGEQTSVIEQLIDKINNK